MELYRQISIKPLSTSGEEARYLLSCGGHHYEANGLVVELGILLDVFVLVFVMGIALFQINQEFEHIDADKLNRLGDWSAPDEEDAEALPTPAEEGR